MKENELVLGLLPSLLVSVYYISGQWWSLLLQCPISSVQSIYIEIFINVPCYSLFFFSFSYFWYFVFDK